MASRRAWRALFGLLAVAPGACRRAGVEEGAPREGTVRMSADVRVPTAPRTAERFDFVQNLGSCEVDHGGILLDFGEPEPHPLSSFEPRVRGPEAVVEREGASFERVQSREISHGFRLDEPRARLTVTARVHGGTARFIHAVVDDKRLGALKLSPGETKTLAFAPLAAELSRGRHRLILRFSGGPRGTKDPYAEIDWVKLGEPSETPETYAAPTFRNIQSDVVLSGAPKRAIVLRAPARVRCWVRPAPDSRLRVGLGFWGQGKGTAEIRVVSDGEPPALLSTRKLSGGDAATWSPVALDLGAFSSRPVGVEFHAVSGTPGGRVAFGDPVLTRKGAESIRVPATRTVILIVGAGLDKRRLPPWGPKTGQSALAELGRVGAAFGLHRATTSVSQGALASMLTGLLPNEHALAQPSERLSATVPTIAEIIKEAGGRAAAFSGVPTSFSPFGFQAGWDVYETFSPVEDLSAGEPYLRAARWLDQELDGDGQVLRFLFVHVRGGHPPWDLTHEETQRLKPEEYSGVIDARRGGILLGALRGKQKKKQRTRLHEDDWVRLRALTDAALAKQDASFARVIDVLKKRGAWESALIVFTGDVAPGDPPDLPFDPAGPLTEDRLLVPLIVKFPGFALSGKEVTTATSSIDVATTILTALGLSESAAGQGADLFARASGVLPLAGAPQHATLKGRFATRFGPWLLRGELKKQPFLCALEIDPACVNDVFAERPFAARALWEATFHAESRALASKIRPASEAAVFDPETVAALTVWGDAP